MRSCTILQLAIVEWARVRQNSGMRMYEIEWPTAAESGLFARDPDDDYDVVPTEEEEERLRQLLLAQQERLRERDRRYIENFRGCPSFRIRVPSRLLTRFFNAVLREDARKRDDYQLRITQFHVLAMVRECGGREPMQEMARRLWMHPSTLTRSLDRLEEHGFVARTFTPSDRRVRTARLTEQGQQVLLSFVNAWMTARWQFAWRIGLDRQRPAFAGVTEVFHASRRVLYDRGLRWEMRAPDGRA